MHSEIARIVKVGDVDANAVAYATPATIAAVNGVQSGGADAVLDATLRVPAVRGPAGWVYDSQAIKAGLPIRFETAGYVIQGQIIKVDIPSEPAR